VRILVTGGAGFIGSHVVADMLSAGHEVAVLDDLSSGKRENVPAGATLFVQDLRDRDGTLAVLQEFRPQAISHQAAQASVAVSVREPLLDAQVNVVGSIHLFDAAIATGVERLVFASTGGAIYGEVAPGTRANEATPPAPESPYAIHKLAVEQLLSVYRRHHALDVRVLRYANVYGPRQDPHGEAGVVAVFFSAARSGQPLRIHAQSTVGDAGCVRDYVYVGDVSRMNQLALSGELLEPVANVGTGVPTTTLDLARAVRKATGRDAPIEFVPPRRGDLLVSQLDPSLVERYLGSTVPLARGLELTHASLA
jgi:UDP-glucose 4-epimerase